MARKKITFFEASIPVTILKENDQYIAYTPSLDISTVGKTFDEAKKRFGELVNIFFEEIIEMGTLEDVLFECGWKKITKPEIKWYPPTIITQTTEEVKIPCPV